MGRCGQVAAGCISASGYLFDLQMAEHRAAPRLGIAQVIGFHGGAGAGAGVAQLPRPGASIRLPLICNKMQRHEPELLFWGLNGNTSASICSSIVCVEIIPVSCDYLVQKYKPIARLMNGW